MYSLALIIFVVSEYDISMSRELALIIFVVSEKKAFEHFPIGFNVKCNFRHKKHRRPSNDQQFGFNFQVVSEKKHFETFFP